MTTYHDPSLQSRRAVRAHERADQATSSQFRPGAVPRPGPVGEPLSYVTQNRPPLPAYDIPPAARGRRVAQPPVERAPEPDAPAPAFRVRDFAPRAPDPAPWVPADPDSGTVDYHTQARSAVVPPPSLATVLAQPGDPIEQTLTRRELRALRDAHDISAAAEPAAPPAATPLAASVARLESAMAEFDSLVARPADVSRNAPPQTVTAPSDGLAPARGRRAAAVAPDAHAAYGLDARAVVVPDTHITAATPAPAVDPTVSRRSGHWTMQGEIDDLTQSSSPPIARRVGAGAITTSALVLPSMPTQDLSTGEILVTGSIDLPRSLSSRGAHADRLDNSDIDHLLDPDDHQVVSTDSIPIRAIRAVSSHTGTRSVLAVKPPKGNRALTALIVAAGGMAVVVVTLLIVALVTDVF